jgi:acetyltransferase-like isoleucine patch superfamily enzyme
VTSTTTLRRALLSEHIVLGQNVELEENAFLGEMTGRQLADLQLIIGDNAIIRSGTVIYLGTTIGADLRTGHNVVIREQNTIGDALQIWSNSIIDYGCRIGNHVKIHCNCYVAQYTIIEDDAFLAPGVIISNDMYPGPMFPDQPLNGPTIKRGAQIGCNCTIRPGVVIGEYSLIGAGSMVTKDIPPRSLAYGNPARVYKSVDEVFKRG